MIYTKWAAQQAANTTTATTLDSLLSLVAAAQWTKKKSQGVIYGAGDFFKLPSFWKTLNREGRKTPLRLAIAGRCFCCRELCNVEGDGDHMCAVACGGTDGIDNWAPSCQRCNQEKGVLEPVLFLVKKGVTLAAADPDWVVHWCRYAYKKARRDGLLESPPPEAWIRWLREFVSSLPTAAHKDVFNMISARDLPSALERSFLPESSVA